MNKIYILSRETDAYGFVKQIAAEKYNISTETLNIARTEHGKPYFLNLPDFYFNISHSGELQAVAVSESNVGVDIEKLRTPDLRVVKRFSENEQTYISETDSPARFFEVWTKKEAYLKYTGTGVSGGLKSFSIFECDATLKTHFFGEYALSVCSDKNFKIIDITGKYL